MAHQSPPKPNDLSCAPHIIVSFTSPEDTMQHDREVSYERVMKCSSEVCVVSSNVMPITQRSLTFPKIRCMMIACCCSSIDTFGNLSILLCLSLLIYSRANSRSTLWYLNKERPLHFFTLADSVPRRRLAPFTQLSKNHSQTVLACLLPNQPQHDNNTLKNRCNYCMTDDSLLIDFVSIVL